jgi:uncharacterized protein (TIGR02246 family)
LNTTDAARRWAETWQRAWEELDLDAILTLYAPDATLLSQPFREPHRGLAAVREYVSGAFAEEESPRVWVGDPIVQDDRAAIEWWAALIEEGKETTLAGTSVLRFTLDGLVIEQRDTWNQAPARRQPPSGWGR